MRPRKSLGQNFLVDSGAAMRIAKAAVEGSSQDEPFRVLEIGPGTGALTQALLEIHDDVTAIDVDTKMIEILQSRCELQSAQIVHADALTFDYAGFAGTKRWRATGNLPYNIATPLMMQLIEMQNGPEQLVFMIQKDVAARLIARPSTPAYGSLSLAVQFGMRVERLFNLGPSVFYPRPKVDSTVVRLTRHAQPPVEVRDVHLLMQVVRGAFAYRRKTLANSLQLALGIPRARVAEALQRIDSSPEIRGEQLSLEQFAALSDSLAT
ncbi:MAG: ribosomal RNA small subunit methyltransferase A [Candidatus Eremiobacteraeota bacterium]|nr:ribosomal RNA small subunit methyltransferase A [Candidatus Eremiobacteraeota bacterium]